MLDATEKRDFLIITISGVKASGKANRFKGAGKLNVELPPA